MKGFSLIEIMLTLTLISILVLISIPHFRDNFSRHQSLSTVNQLLFTLRFARNEAILKGQEVVVFPLKEGLKVTLNNKPVLFSAISKEDTLIWRSSLGHNDQLTFLPTGFTDGQQGSFYYDHLGNVKRIIIERTGRARLSLDSIE